MAFQARPDGTVYESFGSVNRLPCGSLATALASQSQTATSAHILRVRSFNNDFTVHINGVLLASTTTNTVGWDTVSSMLGASGASSGSPVFGFDGMIGAVAIYDHDTVSAAQDAAIMGALRAEFATP